MFHYIYIFARARVKQSETREGGSETMTLSWSKKRKRICYLIKCLSDHYGGDDIEFLKEYAKDVIEAYSDDLDTALNCFTDLTKGIDVSSRGDPEKSVIMVLCETCGYRPPFCRFDLGKGCSFDKQGVREDV